MDGGISMQKSLCSVSRSVGLGCMRTVARPLKAGEGATKYESRCEIGRWPLGWGCGVLSV